MRQSFRPRSDQRGTTSDHTFTGVELVFRKCTQILAEEWESAQNSTPETQHFKA